MFGNMKASTKQRAPSGIGEDDLVWDITPCKETTVVSQTKMICKTPQGIGTNHEIFIETGGRRYAQRNVTAIANIPKCPGKPPPTTILSTNPTATTLAQRLGITH